MNLLTSLVLLLSVEVAQFTLALGSEASLGLHNLLWVVGIARGLVSLVGVKVVEVAAGRCAGIIQVADRVRARACLRVATAATAVHTVTLTRLLNILMSAIDLCDISVSARCVLRRE